MLLFQSLNYILVQETYAIHFETNEEILLTSRLILVRPRICYRLDDRRICIGF